MTLDFAILADTGHVRDNLAYIIGAGLDTLGSIPYPTPNPQGHVGTPVNAVVIVRLMLQRADLGRQHTFELRVLAEDGQQVQLVQAQMYTPPNPELAAGWDQPIVLPPLRLGFAPVAWGFYSVAIHGDNGVLLKTIPFRVAPSQSQAMPGAPSGFQPPPEPPGA